jgi:hypothetical protein
MSYAAQTEVPVDRSKAEIERTLQRYGATEFASGWKMGRAMMQFLMMDRQIRFVLPLPTTEEFKTSEKGRRRTDAQAYTAYEQACRQRWRALLLCIKAKLESAQSGIEAFETAFMGQIVMPNGKTMEELALPQIKLAYESGKMPLALLEY